MAGLQQLGRPADVQVGLLLAGETCLWQVLGGSTTAHGDFGILAALVAREPLVRGDDLAPQSGRQLLSHDHRPDRHPHLIQPGPFVQTPDLRCDPRTQSVAVEQISVRVRRRRETRRHPHACRCQMCGHLSQGGVLATDTADILPTELCERYDPSSGCHDVLRRMCGSRGFSRASTDRRGYADPAAGACAAASAASASECAASLSPLREAEPKTAFDFHDRSGGAVAAVPRGPEARGRVGCTEGTDRPIGKSSPEPVTTEGHTHLTTASATRPGTDGQGRRA